MPNWFARRSPPCWPGLSLSVDGTGKPLEGEQQGTNLLGGLEPGTLKFLDPGQDIKFSTPAGIGAEVIDFAKVTEREIAVGLGLPASVLTGDLSDVNYSSIRAGLVEWRRRIEALQHGVVAFQALRPIWRRWATTEVLSGRVSTTVNAALPVKFIAPKQAWVDPAKDVQAELEAIAGGLMSRREAVTSRGVDIEALDSEIAADNERAASLGLTFTAPIPPTTIRRRHQSANEAARNPNYRELLMSDTTGAFTRAAPLRASSWNAGDLTFDLILSAGAPVERGGYIELLDIAGASWPESIPLLNFAQPRPAGRSDRHGGQYSK